ncbi:hypothetical protein TURU_018504 [Turdus rufiventris]|nr:hypothetical protein TURU_018504 [Turdus rufiventris]
MCFGSDPYLAAVLREALIKSVGLSQKPENIYKNWNVIRRFENLLWETSQSDQSQDSGVSEAPARAVSQRLRYE